MESEDSGKTNLKSFIIGMIWQLCYLKLLQCNVLQSNFKTFIIFIDALDERVEAKLDELVLKYPHVSFLRQKPSIKFTK